MATRSTKSVIVIDKIRLDVKYSLATSRESIKLTTISTDLNKVRNETKTFDVVTNKSLSKDEITKGYEISPNVFIPITKDDLKDSDEDIFKIESFVPLSSIENYMVEKSYYVKPNDAGHTFALFANVMAKKKVCGIGYRDNKGDKTLGILSPHKGGLMFQPIFFKNEVRDYDNNLPEVRITNQDRQLANKIVDNMTNSEFNHGFYRDYSKEEFFLILHKKKLKFNKSPQLTDTLKAVENKTRKSD
jgi:Ku protein